MTTGNSFFDKGLETTGSLSAELYVIFNGKKLGSGTDVNNPLRGIGEQGLKLRENFQLT